MVAKKKTKKKQTKSKPTASKKAAKKLSMKAGKKPAAKRASAKKRAVPKKAVRKKSSKKTKAPVRKRVGTVDKTAETPAFLRERSRARMAGQSGDLQGLSDVETADSESVDELLEEGNAFEADIVRGVQEAGNQDGREVHTHEVPEDDVPEEYLDED